PHGLPLWADATNLYGDRPGRSLSYHRHPAADPRYSGRLPMGNVPAQPRRGPSRSPVPASTRIVWPGSLIGKALTDASTGCLTHDLAISFSASALLGFARTLRTKKPPLPSERAVTSILPILIR